MLGLLALPELPAAAMPPWLPAESSVTRVALSRRWHDTRPVCRGSGAVFRGAPEDSQRACSQRGQARRQAPRQTASAPAACPRRDLPPQGGARLRGAHLFRTSRFLGFGSEVRRIRSRTQKRSLDPTKAHRSKVCSSCLTLQTSDPGILTLDCLASENGRGSFRRQPPSCCPRRRHQAPDQGCLLDPRCGGQGLVDSSIHRDLRNRYEQVLVNICEDSKLEGLKGQSLNPGSGGHFCESSLRAPKGRVHHDKMKHSERAKRRLGSPAVPPAAPGTGTSTPGEKRDVGAAACGCGPSR